MCSPSVDFSLTWLRQSAASPQKSRSGSTATVSIRHPKLLPHFNLWTSSVSRRL
jgi:hypothetical protein